MPRSSALSSAPAAGIWSLDGDTLSPMASFAAGPAIVLVPSESVLLTIVDLPLPTRSGRLSALPFAVEDRIAVSLSAVHIAIGSEVAPGRFLAGVVDHALIRRWSDMLADADLDDARLVPDALALPIPTTGAWSVDIAAARAMVRADDGSGFALPVANLEAAWRAAGQPAVRAYGAVPTFADAVAELEVEPLAARLTAPALDVRQGPYAPPRQTAFPLLRRIALVGGFGLLAHGAIAAADTFALDHLVRQRAAETRALAQQVAPGLAIGDDAASTLAARLPASEPSTFLPLLGRVTAALAPLGPTVTMVDLSFDGADGTIAIDMDAPDAAALERVAQAFATAGLVAQSGAVRIAPGKASRAFSIRGTR